MESSRPMIEAKIPPLTFAGRSVIATASVSFFLSLTWTLLRIWARYLRRVTPFMLEDYFCYIALVGFPTTPPRYSLFRASNNDV
ncbi:hypothetical protein GGS24DRAFT_122014 [Hypoxylon argillaceum]|nr:hypothetical protein GGS24DRAFT_122014 [Hypoxylon argillaceum]